MEDLLKNELGGLECDYSEKVQNILDKEKHKKHIKYQRQLLNELQQKLAKEITTVAEIRTIASFTNPTEITLNVVQQKLQSKQFRQHGMTKACLNAYNEDLKRS